MHRTRLFGITTLTALALLSGACSGGGGVGSPDSVVQEFYAQVNDGEAGAVEYYDASTRAMFEDPEMAGDNAFVEWTRSESRQGTIQEVEILDSSVEADSAEVSFRVSYADGSSRDAAVSMTREDGIWKLGLIR